MLTSNWAHVLGGVTMWRICLSATLRLPTIVMTPARQPHMSGHVGPLLSPLQMRMSTPRGADVGWTISSMSFLTRRRLQKHAGRSPRALADADGACLLELVESAGDNRRWRSDGHLAPAQSGRQSRAGNWLRAEPNVAVRLRDRRQNLHEVKATQVRGGRHRMPAQRRLNAAALIRPIDALAVRSAPHTRQRGKACG